MAKAELATAIAALGLSIRAEFVPLSRSRNADQKDERGRRRQSLNWKVTLVQTDRDILTTDYGAGSGHCPADKVKCPAGWHSDAAAFKREAIEFECEHGNAATVVYGRLSPKGGKPILPDTCDVIHSLVSDASVIDCATFEEWASDLGYDTDSRKAETIYRACLEIALKLRNGIGDAAMHQLAEAGQDY